MICDQDPRRRKPRESTARKTVGEVCLDGENTGRMGFRTRSDQQNQAVGCQRWRHNPNGSEIWVRITMELKVIREMSA